MSLQVDGHRRGRSRSPGGRDRDRSRSRTPALIVDTDPSHYDSYNKYSNNGTKPYDAYDEDRQYRSSMYKNPMSPTIDDLYRTSTTDLYNQRDSPRQHHSSDSDRDRERTGGLMDAFLPQKYAKKLETSDAYNFMTSPLSERSRERSRDRRREKKEKLEEDLAYGKLPASPGLMSPTYGDYGLGGKGQFSSGYDYEKTEVSSTSYSYPARDNPRYSTDALGVSSTHGRTRSKSPAPRHAHHKRESSDTLDVRHDGSGRSRSKSPAGRHHRSSSRGDRSDKKEKKEKHSHSHSHKDSLTVDPRGSSVSIMTVEPGETQPRKSAMKRSSSPQPPVNKMASLSVNTAYNAGALSVSAAPASPLLESYHGTYQSMSPMPSPLLLPSKFAFDAPPLDLSPINSDDERAGGKKRSRRARFTDPEDDAQRIGEALRGSKAPKTEPLIEILPGLTHEQVMNLRAEYKKLVRTGPEKKGVNVAKHIRVRLKDEDPALMKACYATALGKWESEAYWSSFWYQGNKTRRELLIESLMGRPNDEIHEIKEAFRDKTYDDSLIKCMKHELKEDKFKKAVLMVLDEKRMEDVDRHGRRLPIDHDLVRDDVHDLRQAVKSEKGGESAMISIIVNRSDEHLREILREYTDEYRSNFARDALRKSGNLVVSPLPSLLFYHKARHVETNQSNRANFSHTFSTASSTSPSATHCSCTMRSRRPKRMACDVSS